MFSINKRNIMTEDLAGELQTPPCSMHNRYFAGADRCTRPILRDGLSTFRLVAEALSYGIPVFPIAGISLGEKAKQWHCSADRKRYDNSRTGTISCPAVFWKIAGFIPIYCGVRYCTYPKPSPWGEGDKNLWFLTDEVFWQSALHCKPLCCQAIIGLRAVIDVLIGLGTVGSLSLTFCHSLEIVPLTVCFQFEHIANFLCQERFDKLK